MPYTTMVPSLEPVLNGEEPFLVFVEQTTKKTMELYLEPTRMRSSKNSQVHAVRIVVAEERPVQHPAVGLDKFEGKDEKPQS